MLRPKVVAGRVGRAEEGGLTPADMLVARVDVAGGAKGRDIGTVGGRLSGTVTSAVEEGSDPAAGFLSIRSPTFGAGGLSTADSTLLGPCSLVAGSAAALAVRAGRLSALKANNTLSIIPGALTTLALASSATATLEAPVCNG